MKEKIQNSLNIIDNIDFDVWFDETTGCGIVTLRSSSVTSTILELITNVVDLVSITCTPLHSYNISFKTK